MAWETLSDEDDLGNVRGWADLSSDEASAEAWGGLSEDSPGELGPSSGESSVEQDGILASDGLPASSAGRGRSEFGHDLASLDGPRRGRRRRVGLHKLLQPAFADITAFRAGEASGSASGNGEGRLALVDEGGPAADAAAIVVAGAGGADAPQGAGDLPGLDSTVVATLRESRPLRRYAKVGDSLEKAAFLCSAASSGDFEVKDWPVSDEERKVIDCFLYDKTRFASTTTASELRNASAKTFAKMRRWSAAVMYIAHGCDALRVLGHICEDIQKAGGECCALIQKYKGDEAEFKMTVSDREAIQVPLGAQAVVLANRPAALEAVAQQSARTKVLQCQRSYAALFCDPGGNFFTVTFECPCPLQVMSSTAMDVYYQCFVRSELPVDSVAQMFKRRYRVCVTDGDKAVAASLRGVAAGDEGTLQWHQVCEVHRVSNLLTHVMKPGDLDTSVHALIHTALSLQGANAMREFREALRQALAARLLFKESAPKQGDLQRNWAIIRLCIPGESRTNVLKQSIILRLLNGNWERSRVEHHCRGPECCASREQCLAKMATLLVACFAAAAPPTFPRHRWTGSVAAVSWQLLLLMCHNLLPVVYQVWAARKHGGKAGEVEALLQGPMGHGDDQGLAPREALPDDRGPGDMYGIASSGADGARGLNAEGALGPGKEGDVQRLLQSQYRQTAISWLSKNDPAGLLFVMRLVLGPLNDCMDKLLQSAGRSWDRSQDVQQANAAKQKAKVPRQFRVCLAEAGHIVDGPLQDLIRLMTDADAWSLLDLRFRGLVLQTRAALMLSQAACGLQQMKERYSAFPIKLFGLLRDETLAANFLAAPPCMLDNFTKEFLAKHRASGLNSPGCIAELSALAAMVDLDIAGVEAQHASIRRQQFIMSTQTNTQHIEDASAEFVLRRFRNLGLGKHRAPAEKSVEPSIEHGSAVAEQPKPKPRPGSGGAWRAFVREETLGTTGSCDFSALKEKYHLLSPKAKKRLAEDGQAATERARKVGVAKQASAFGLSTRERERKKRRLDEARLLAAGRQEEVQAGAPVAMLKGPRFSDKAQPSTMLALGTREASFRPLQDIRQQGLLHQRLRKQQQQVDDAALADYHATVGQQLVGESSSVSAAIRARSMEPVPNTVLPTLRWATNGTRDRMSAALAMPKKCQAARALFPTLEQVWAAMHTSVQGDKAVRDFLSSTKAKNNPECHRHNCCLCGNRGLRTLAAALDMALKRLCPPHSSERRKLVQGEIVVLFFGQTKEDCDADREAAAPLSGRPMLPIAISEWAFGHIADQCLSPWDTWFQTVHPLAGVGRNPLQVADLVRVRLSGTFQGARAWLRSLCVNLRWSSIVMQVAWTPRMLGSFCPDNVQLRFLDDGKSDLHVLWDPFNKEATKPAMPKLGWERTLAEDSGAEMGDDEDCGDSEADSNSGADAFSESDAGPDDPKEVADSNSDRGGGEAEDSSGESVAALVELTGVAPIDEGEGGGGGEGDNRSCGSYSSKRRSHRSNESSSSSSGSSSSESSGEADGIDSDVGSHLAAPSAVVDEVEGGGEARDYIELTPQHRLTFFELGSRRDMIVKCQTHKGCVFTRTVNPSAAGSRIGQGRCIGLVTAWALAAGEYSSKAEHVRGCRPDLAARQAAREFFGTLPNSTFYLGKERPQREGEPAEPVHVP